MTPGYEFADDDSHSKYMSDHSRNKSAYDRDMQDSEVIRDEFRRPRDTLLSLVSDFYSKSSARLMELAKKGGAEAKPVELLDSKSHVVSTVDWVLARRALRNGDYLLTATVRGGHEPAQSESL